MLLVLVLACHTEPTYYQDVAPILEARCVNCHSTGSIGGFSLEDPDYVAEIAPAIAHAVSSKTMPPWTADNTTSLAFVNDWSLTEEEIATIVEWADAGAHLGKEKDKGTELDFIGTSLSRVDKEISIPEPYTSSADIGDDYRCFVLDWTETESTYITGFNAIPDNAQIVHHIAAFLVRPDGLLGASVFDSIQEWEDADAEQGYSCFGGPSGAGASSQVPIEQIAQWVPGNQGMDFPENTGIPIDPGSKIILQLHYNITPTTESKTDQTRLQFSLADTVERNAAYAPWLNAVWPMGGMTVPANSAYVEHSINGDPRSFFNLLNPNLQLDQGFTIHAMMMHMHRLGSSGSLQLHKTNGETITLVDIPNWDFDWQFTYVLENSVDFQDGDSLELSCVFANSGDTDVAWGEGTDDEMCVGNLYISTPKSE